MFWSPSLISVALRRKPKKYKSSWTQNWKRPTRITWITWVWELKLWNWNRGNPMAFTSNAQKVVFSLYENCIIILYLCILCFFSGCTLTVSPFGWGWRISSKVSDGCCFLGSKNRNLASWMKATFINWTGLWSFCKSDFALLLFGNMLTADGTGCFPGFNPSALGMLMTAMRSRRYVDVVTNGEKV